MSSNLTAPSHVAIVMDGNGRWAARRGLPRSVGHRKGVDRIHPIALACAQRGVRFLTLFAFSTENWKRPRTEVAVLMGLLGDMIDAEAQTCLRDNIRLALVGSVRHLSRALASSVSDAVALNSNNTGLTLGLAFDYGSHAEIVNAARAIAESGVVAGDVDENLVQRHLQTADMPDVDLLIRCGGEVRLSNFLMWQSAYAELYFTEVLWPEFGEEDLDAAFESFALRERRFGDIRKDGNGR